MATLTETFTNIANSIRLKTETTDKITPENMPSMIEGITTGGNVAELSITSNGTYRAPEGIDGYTPVIVNVPQDGSPPAEGLVIKGDCAYRFANNGWNWFIKQYGRQITTNKITDCSNMFYFSSGLEEIPFELDMSGGTNYSQMFMLCQKLKYIPKINAKNSSPMIMKGIFEGCYNLREIPEDIEDWFNWSQMDNNTSTYGGTQRANTFKDCHSLRKVPMGFLNHGGKNESYTHSIYPSLFNNCYVLDEVVDLPIPHYNATWGGYSFYNAFSDTFQKCGRLKRMTFKTQEDGTPYKVNWNYQTINLGFYVGFAYNTSTISNYSSGLTEATQITDDATYQALKDNPDSWTTKTEYSRYNKISAIETINSLPDTSAYVEASKPNTIKFSGDCGSKTDGGAINTMTEEEIAVATAKGWTVSFS